MRRRRSVVVATVAAVLAVAGFGLSWSGQSEPTPWSKPADVEGDVVHLRYVGSQCQDGSSVDVEESPRKVVLTVRTTMRASSCPDVGVTYRIDARLDAPLGDRELVDGACLTEPYSGYTACGGARTH